MFSSYTQLLQQFGNRHLIDLDEAAHVIGIAPKTARLRHYEPGRAALPFPTVQLCRKGKLLVRVSDLAAVIDGVPLPSSAAPETPPTLAPQPTQPVKRGPGRPRKMGVKS